MGDWMTKDEDGRWRADLHLLPRWISLTLAGAVVGIVVMLARRFDPEPAVPAWLPATINTGAALIIAVGSLLAARWVALRWRRSVRDCRHRIQK